MGINPVAKVAMRTLSQAAEMGSAASSSVEIASGTQRSISAVGQTLAERARTAQENIQQIAASINTLTLETSMLAFNASIEAARAGDAGRGFAVVATEVGILSDATKKAAKDIEAQVRNLGEVLELAVGSLKKEAKNVNAIREATDGTTSHTGEVTQQVVNMKDDVREVSSAVKNIMRRFGDLMKESEDKGSMKLEAKAAA